ncbi:pyridoxal phosphate-dependent decarboxylase family protein [Flavilitoribacter nigricans]|uniref:Amino acid decarboxylase n=1 Tax=Flavilitoribacter nigricans (strain ATCC 23147 / DSM 23189 / NBRC 102662 / NCIMB 1420 / SS-2) TaxID=1122177 RepID=A0A2D0N6A1_FLAN2|nr:pyridoxal-dependent decarboxylase [Flavilitoribacter nigricans]PHN03918.1 amino acid decarboxylase [Flavilitoribacter nigricans DSM 23189 = NBRC 102662]
MGKNNTTPIAPEVAAESLDPQDWEQARSLMHQMVDDAIDFIAGVRERPIWQEMPDEVLETFQTSLPQEPQSAEAVYQEFKENILPYPMGTVHPRFWAWYMGAGTFSGAAADFLASITNSNLGGGNHAAHKVEEQVINWMKEIMGFPATASGLLVSGGSMANLLGLTVGRNVQAGYDLREEGIKDGKRFTVYASTEVHSCNQKAVELLGMGSRSLRKIAVNEDYTINLDALREQIERDRCEGLQPICVIGSAGTVNTGAVDDIDALADLCAAEGLWLHIDGAIGAIGMLADNVRPQIAALSRADSLAIDLHKWMHMPFEAACVLVKNQDAHKNTFALIPEYLAKNTRGVASGSNWFSEYGPQLSRRFRALKVWMSLKEHGAKKFGRMIARNVEQAHYLKDLIEQHPDLELIAPVGMDIVCFRYQPAGLNTEALNALNKEIKLQLEERGIAAPGYTTLGGRYCLRIAISNHRSREEDFDLLVEQVCRIGEEIRN